MYGLIGAFGRPGVVFADEMVHAALSHTERRSPDEGTWRDEGSVLGHRRLANIDLYPRAVQSMHSIDGRYVIVYNGEIYNYPDLRRDLETRDTPFRTKSDAEAILALFAANGAAMTPRLHGMFAFVIWDRVAKQAFSARDTYEIKSLYYAETLQGALAASHVKPLLATGLGFYEPDVRGQAGFWLPGSVPAPRTWFREIRALPAGHFAWIDQGRVTAPKRWWGIGDAWRSAQPGRIPDVEACEGVRSAPRESGAWHLVADVPIGVFLSGGIDSGALARLMIGAGKRALEGGTHAYDEFAGSPKDEAPVAARIGTYYRIRHYVRRVTRDEFFADLPQILDAMDRPSIDDVNPWYAIKAVTEMDLQVVLSGVGGDEPFQDYSSLRDLPWLVCARRTVARIPGSTVMLQWLVNCQSRHTGNHRWHHLLEWSTSITGASWLRRSLYHPEDLTDLLGRVFATYAMRDFDATRYLEGMSGAIPMNPRLALGQFESTTHLRNQLLRDSDWASVSHSVELRMRLVDAWRLHSLTPLLPSFSRQSEKLLLARAPEKLLMEEVIRRSKTGFGILVGCWLMRRHGVTDDIGSRGWVRELADAYGAPTR